MDTSGPRRRSDRIEASREVARRALRVRTRPRAASRRRGLRGLRRASRDAISPVAFRGIRFGDGGRRPRLRSADLFVSNMQGNYSYAHLHERHAKSTLIGTGNLSYQERVERNRWVGRRLFGSFATMSSDSGRALPPSRRSDDRTSAPPCSDRYLERPPAPPPSGGRLDSGGLPPRNERRRRDPRPVPRDRRTTPEHRRCESRRGAHRSVRPGGSPGRRPPDRVRARQVPRGWRLGARIVGRDAKTPPKVDRRRRENGAKIDRAAFRTPDRRRRGKTRFRAA